jgi:DNA-directed RNA polymerase subunit RPC12/RpoP
MVPNQLHVLHIGANSDRVLGERPQIQIPSTTLLPAFYQTQESTRRKIPMTTISSKEKVKNKLKCPECGYLLTPIIHLDLPHISYVCHKCKTRFNKPEYPQKQIDRWL